MAFIKNLLLAFGGIALFVGGLVIANTLSITVAQRVRNFATLRTLGSSRRLRCACKARRDSSDRADAVFPHEKNQAFARGDETRRCLSISLGTYE